jgi:hypothetical protein
MLVRLRSCQTLRDPPRHEPMKFFEPSPFADPDGSAAKGSNRRAKADRPTRAEAIRRLVELGLRGKAK